MSVKRVSAKVRHFDRLPSGSKMLAACGPAGQWLRKHAAVGQQLRIAERITTTTGAKVETFLSGQRTLRKDGKPYNDTSSGFHTTGINPETAACVSQDQRHVLLVAVDGWISRLGGGAGITLPELKDLTAALHCYTAVVFDGGGSTTMVARRAGLVRVLNRMPQFYGQRPVPNGLFVVKG
jgi:exopolysaccharide biosynthesis protein